LKVGNEGRKIKTEGGGGRCKGGGGGDIQIRGKG